MNVEASITVDAPPDVVWSVVSNIEDSPKTISGIDEVEILERPAQGLLGLKWRETRTMGGKKATETMWITDVQEGSYYETEARSHGSIYRSRVEVSEGAGGTVLKMHFSVEPVSLGARVFSFLFGPLVRGAIKKAFIKDLQDSKAAAEMRATRAPAGS